VVSDNSDADHADRNAAVVESLNSTVDIRIVRPNATLNMLGHWNFALGHTRGTYVGIVTDRMTLLPSALADVRPHLIGGADCVSFSHTTLRAPYSAAALNPPLSAASVEQMDAQAVLSLFARGGATKACPRLLNCFTRSEVLTRMKDDAGEALLGISPDYSFLFNYLARYPAYLHLHRQYLVDHAPQVSNGSAATQNKPNRAFSDFHARMLNEQQDTMALRPLPKDYIFFANIVLSEYVLASQKTPGANLPPLDPAGIYASCWSQARKIAAYGNEATDIALELLEAYRIQNNLPRPSMVDRLNMAWRKRRNLIKRRNTERLNAAQAAPRQFELARELSRGHEVLAALQSLDA
tara:strand:+ start:982 stop:2037 length:1056 start_codon:yes stop_codon:yes gene_type:complete